MFRKFPFAVILRAIVSVAAFGSMLVAVHAQTAAAPAPDPLVTVNSEFRDRYALARSEALARTGPVIVVYEGEKLALIHKGKRVEARFVPASDAALKAVAHVPLGVFTSLRTLAGTTLDDAALHSLSKYRTLIAAASASLDSRGFSETILDRQRRILAESILFLDGVMTAKEITPEGLESFARRLGPLVLENTADAARAQIDGLHAQVDTWRKTLTNAEWKSLHVVVIGVHMARDGELATQYFLRLLGESEEGRRVVYAEGLWDEAKALDLLGTHVLDGSVGEAFFGSFLRMHRDVLSDAARAHLDSLHVGP